MNISGLDERRRRFIRIACRFAFKHIRCSQRCLRPECRDRHAVHCPQLLISVHALQWPHRSFDLVIRSFFFSRLSRLRAVSFSRGFSFGTFGSLVAFFVLRSSVETPATAIGMARNTVCSVGSSSLQPWQ